MALNRDRIFKAADKYIHSGKIEKAIAEFEKWVAANPKDWNTIRQIGDLYARIGRNEEAIKKYAQIADYYRQDGFNVRAIATHKMILRLDPQNETAMRNLAELQVIQGLLMEAKAQYQALVELYTKTGHKRQATEVFKKLAEIDPSDLKVRYKFAEFLEREGKVEEAVAEYVGIADEFINKGLVAEAIQIMEKGLRIDNASRLLRTKLAQAAMLQGHHDKAIQLLEEVREQHPRDVELLSRLGEAYMGAGRAAEAEAMFRRLAELEPDNAEHASRLAELAIGQGNCDQALEILAPAVDSLVAGKDGEKAAAQLQKILNRDPHHTKTLLKLVEVQTILKQDAGKASAFDKLCEAYSKQGDYEKAVRVAEQLIELEPENSQHKDRVRFLKSKLGAPASPTVPAPARKARAPSAPAPPAAAPPPQEAASVPAVMDEDIQPGVELDTDIAEAPLDVSELSEPVIDIDEALSGPLEVEPSVVEPPSEQTQQEIDAVATLNSEDEENIKEKMTEAEVFVRYGLVDKAVEQLKDVLDRFRFHTAAREKLIEIYRDQGMSNEAAEELAQLSTIYTRLGQNDNAEKARIEARSINPALEEIPGEVLVPEDEVDLMPESPEQYDDLALDVEAPAVASLEEIPQEIPQEINDPDEVAVSMDEDDLPFAIEEADEEEEQPSVSEPTDDVEVVISDAPDEFSVEVDADDVASEIGSAAEPAPRVEDEPVPIVPTVEEEPVSMEEEELAEELSLPPAPVIDELSIPDDEFSVGAESSPAAEDVEIDLDGLAGEEPDDDIQVEFDEGPAEISEASEPSAASDADSPFEEEDRTVPPGQADQASQAASPPSAPVVAPPPEPVPAAPAVRDDLAEVDEYMALGLYEDARDTLREILRKRPDDAQVLAKIDEVGFSVAQLQHEAEAPAAASGTASLVEESLVSAASTPVPVPEVAEVAEPEALVSSVPEVPATSEVAAAPEVEEDPFAALEGVAELDEVESVLSGPAGIEGEYVDLASELSDEVFGTQSAVEETSSSGSPIDAVTDPGLDEMFREFKKGVEKQLGTEDYDTRYNLGIAYKEMGLLDEAIAEFQLASKDQGRLLECCSMLGLCFLEKGMPQIAIKWFEKGLNSPGRSEEEQHGLRYDLAIAYESAGEPDRALELYMDIYRVNARFRDVKDRVSGLQAAKN